MEGSDPVGLWETIVLASVNNQLGSAPLVDVIRWAEPARPIGEHSSETNGSRINNELLGEFLGGTFPWLSTELMVELR